MYLCNFCVKIAYLTDLSLSPLHFILFSCHFSLLSTFSVSLSSPVCQVAPEELTLVHNLRKMINNDWVRTAWSCYPLCLIDIRKLHDCYLHHHPYLSLSFSPQCGGAVIATLSQTGSLYAPSSAYLPQELLGEVRGHVYILVNVVVCPVQKRPLTLGVY